MTDTQSPPHRGAATSQWSGTLKRVFCGTQGLRMGWKALLFVSMVAALYLAVQPLLNQVAPRPRAGLISLRTELIRKFCLVLLVLAATWVMATLERRSVRSYGYADAAGPRRLLVGACCGFVSISALVAALWLHGSSVTGLLAVHVGSRARLLVGRTDLVGGIRAPARRKCRGDAARTARRRLRRFFVLPELVVHEVAVLGRGFSHRLRLGGVLLLRYCEQWSGHPVVLARITSNGGPPLERWIRGTGGQCGVAAAPVGIAGRHVRLVGPRQAGSGLARAMAVQLVSFPGATSKRRLPRRWNRGM
jgi:hypothetical protein